MKITNQTPIRNVTSLKARKTGANSSAADFSDLLSEVSAGDTQAPPPVENSVAVSNLNPLLSLQEMPDEEVRRKKAMIHADTTLQALEQLRNGLLLGTIPEHVLRNINSLLLEKRQQISDPRLIGILDDIELRAAVELAKMERDQ